MHKPNLTGDDKLDFRKILPVFVIVLIDLLGMTIIIPLMPLYAASFGATALVIGIMGAVYPAAQFFGAPFLGRFSDRYGRKPILLVSQLGTFIGFLVLGLASSLPWLLIARLVDGLSGANISTAQAVISDSTSEKTRTQGLGLVGAAFGLGFVVGPIVAFLSLVASNNNYHVPAFVAAGFSALSMALTWFWLPETLPPESRGTAMHKAPISFGAMWQALRRPQVGLLLVLIFMQQIAFGGFEQLLALFTLNRLGLNASGNAVIFVFVGIVVVAVQGGFIGTWSRKLGDRRLTYMGLITLALGLALTALTPAQPVPWYSRPALVAELTEHNNQPAHTNTYATGAVHVALPSDDHNGWLGLTWILVAMIPAAVGGGVLQPSLNSLITKRVALHEIGGTLGISAAFLSGANALAPLIGGALFQGFGSTAPFLAGAVVLGLLFVAAWQLVGPGREELAQASLNA